MFGQAISISRLRFYEQECRLARASAGDSLTERELSYFEQMFARAAAEKAALNEQLAEHRLD
jgi:hypothetical protein